MMSTEQLLNIHEIKIGVVKLTILSLLCGISLPLFLRATWKLRRRGLSMRSSQIVLGVCATNMFLLILTFGIIFAMVLLTLGRTNPDSEPSEEHSLLAIVIFQEISMQLVPLISDAIVVWRAVALCSEMRWTPVILLSIFLGTTVISIFSFVVFDYQAAVSSALGSSNDRPGLDPSSLMLFLPFSTVTNAVATLCIWLKLWSYRKQFKALDSSVDRILVLLVESGVLYCVLQLVNLFVTYLQNRYSVATSIVFPVYFAFTAMYPSMVVVFINEKRSVVDTFIMSMGEQPTLVLMKDAAQPSGQLSFVSFDPQETTDSHISMISESHSQPHIS